MRETLNNLYFGNIRPCERRLSASPDLLRASEKIVQSERRLAKCLDKSEQTLLNDLEDAQQEINSISAVENFILGFRLGVRMMVECIADDGSDT